MNRRSFLGLIAAAPVALAALPAEVPIAQTINEGINPDWDGTFRGVCFMESTASGYGHWAEQKFRQTGKTELTHSQFKEWLDLWNEQQKIN